MFLAREQAKFDENRIKIEEVMTKNSWESDDNLQMKSATYGGVVHFLL